MVNKTGRFLYTLYQTDNGFVERFIPRAQWYHVVAFNLEQAICFITKNMWKKLDFGLGIEKHVWYENDVTKWTSWENMLEKVKC